MDMGGRINACRTRLRHTRAMQRVAARSDAAAEPQTLSVSPLKQSSDGERSSQEAGTISVDAESHVDWIEDGAMPEVDRRPSPRARFSTEEETVRA